MKCIIRLIFNNVGLLIIGMSVVGFVIMFVVVLFFLNDYFGILIIEIVIFLEGDGYEIWEIEVFNNCIEVEMIYGGKELEFEIDV